MSSRGDSVILIGPWSSGAQANGQFQNQMGVAAWNGWTHRDLTEREEIHWQISTYQASNLGPEPSPDNNALWCGEADFESCLEGDLAGGYGNNWYERIQWTKPVFLPTLPAQIHLTARVNVDIEPGYDLFYLYVLTGESPLEIAAFDGQYSNHLIDVSFTVDPADFQGQSLDEVGLQFRFQSDGAWSDEDCLWPSAGAIQIDNIAVTMTQGEETYADLSDFESGMGNWKALPPLSVGDFAQIWTGLQDLDPCRQNFTPQVAFLDDGLVVPGVGPSLCVDWCYGPYGYVVNHTDGRLAGTSAPSQSLHNVVESPVLAWPEAELEGSLLEFDVYRHEEITADSPGMFYRWWVRSTDSDDPADIVAAPWRDRNFIYFGGPDYTRQPFVVSDLMVPGRKYAQVRLGVFDSQSPPFQNGTNGTPAPYFDNVRLTAAPIMGPSLFSRETQLAQDAFPEQGILDLEDLGTNHVRFDMADALPRYFDEDVVPGDSLVVDIAAARAGGELVGDVTMHYILRANPVFDAYRTSGLPSLGAVAGVPASYGPNIVEGRFAFDLPDSSFLFPGDVLHYYFSAAEDNGVSIQTATLPADTTGFGDFSSPLAYDTSFTMRALPSVLELLPGELHTPEVLFWNDAAKSGSQAEWHQALANLGFQPGEGYDTYYTNGPDTGVGNGLGGRATPALLDAYSVLLYSSGTLNYRNLEMEGSTEAGGNDVALLDTWLRSGGKNLLMTGDGLVQSLARDQFGAPEFLDQWLGVSLVDPYLKPLIQNQTAAVVRTIAGAGSWLGDHQWVAYGSCPGLNRFDAVITDYAAGAIQLAEFLDPGGNSGVYPYAAATLKPNLEFDAKVMSLPYDFGNIFDAPGADKSIAPLPARAVLLDRIFGAFEMDTPGEYSSVPAAQQFALDSYPNPFNPSTRIAYTMPRAGHLSLKVFDLRGRLVNTLIDQHQEISGQVVWDGVDDRGHKVGSGVYFAEARTAGRVLVQKMLMVK